MERKEKRLLFIFGVILLIGLPIYYYLPMLVALTANILFLVMILVGLVILITILGYVWNRL